MPVSVSLSRILCRDVTTQKVVTWRQGIVTFWRSLQISRSSSVLRLGSFCTANTSIRRRRKRVYQISQFCKRHLLENVRTNFTNQLKYSLREIVTVRGFCKSVTPNMQHVSQQCIIPQIFNRLICPYRCMPNWDVVAYCCAVSGNCSKIKMTAQIIIIIEVRCTFGAEQNEA